MEAMKVYCEVGFLRDFLESIESPFSDKGEIIMQIIKFLSRATIVFDAAKESVVSKFINNPVFKVIFKSSLAGHNSGYHKWLDEDFCNISQSSKPNMLAIYLTTLPKIECERKMKKFGVMVFNCDTLLKAEHLFVDCGISLPNTEKIKKGWKSILGYEYVNKCNSLIIIDNYILQSNDKQTWGNKSVQEKIKNNLIPILDCLLPKEIDETNPFHLYIFACEGNSYPFKTLMKDDNENGIPMQIKQLRGGKVPIKIKLIKCNKEFHDRIILTNNLMVSSGLGFDLFKEGSYTVDKPTSVSVIFPFIQSFNSWAEKYYMDILNFALKAEKNNIKYGDSFEHRLLLC